MTDSSIAAMRPRLREDVFWAAVEGGAVHAYGSRGGTTLRGADTHAWLERLAPFLDGTHTVGELTRSLPRDRREKVENLLTLLHREGVLTDLSQDQAHSLSESDRHRYAEQLRYLAQLTDDPGARFQRHRESRVLVLGAGRTLLALVEAALRSGVRQMGVVVTGAPALDELTALLADACPADPARHTTVRHTDDVGRLADLIVDADAVLQVSGASDPELERLCAQHGADLVQVVVRGDEAWLGPPAGPAGSWDGLWRRLRAAAGHTDAPMHADNSPDAEGPDVSGELATVLAGLVVMRWFRHSTGIEPLAATTVVGIDLSGPATAAHTALPHPLALPAGPRTAEEFRARIAELDAGERWDEPTFSRAAATCVDARLGILTALSERHFEQLPLWITEARVSDPVGLLARWGVPGAVYGAALEFTEARHRAARLGLELYAAAMLDGRLVHPGPDGGAVWGWDLANGGERLVPVSAVFDPGGPWLSHVPVGVASGPTWTVAVETGLLRCVEALTVAEALRVTEARFLSVDLDEAPLDDVGRRLLRILRVGHADVAAYDITGAAGVPTYSVYLGARPVAHAAGWADADALRVGLERAVLAYQAALSGQPEYDPPAVPGLPAAARGGTGLPFRARAAFLDRADRAAQLAARLECTPVAVPLDHDPALASVLPYVVRVVLAPPWEADE